MKFTCVINQIQLVGQAVVIDYNMADSNGFTAKGTMTLDYETFKKLENFKVGSSFTRVDETDGKDLTTTYYPA